MQNNQNKEMSQNNDKKNLDKGEHLGSNLSPEEKEFRKYDDYKSHSHEKDRNLDAQFREGELHGVVGKEIHDVLQKDKAQHEVDLEDEYKFHKKHEKLHHRKSSHEHEKHHEKESDTHHNSNKSHHQGHQ